jgi:hypothetical protein
MARLLSVILLVLCPQAFAEYVFDEPSYVSGVLDICYLDVADLNGDGLPDIVASTGPLTPDPGIVCVFMNAGEGVFTCNQFTQNGYIRGLAIGEFNGDAIPDLAISSGGITVYLGVGDGSFLPPMTQAQTGIPFTACDLNNDGQDDFLCGGNGDVYVHLCDGDGTFTYNGNFELTDPSDGPFTIADMNLDGNLDLLYPEHGGGYILGILYGNGDGTLQTPLSFIYQSGDRELGPSVAVGDYNEDGLPDVSVTKGCVMSGGRYTIALSDGNGNFTVSDSLTQGTIDTWQTVADFDMDGHLDLAYVHEGSEYNCRVAPGAGDGTFFDAPDDLLFETPGDKQIASSDFDLDGDPDLVIPWDVMPWDWSSSQGLCVYLNNTVPQGVTEGEGCDGAFRLDPSCNPFASVVTITLAGTPVPTQLAVYDLSGCIVRALFRNGENSFLWDGCSASGEELPAGTYVIQGASAGRFTAVKVVKL